MAATSSDRGLRSDLMQMTLGYWRSQILFACVGLGVFDLLSKGGRSVEEIARASSADVDQTERLLHAAVLLDLLVRDNDLFMNSRLASELLVDGGDRSMIDWVRFMADCYAPWGQLARSVTTGRPVASREEQFGQDTDSMRNLILAMRDYARGPGRAMTTNLDLRGRSRLLDVGGGPGTYSIALAEKYPELECVVFDLPPVVAITQLLIGEKGLEDRVTTQAGDYLTDELGSGYDVVLLSNMLHQEDPSECQAVLKQAYDALVPGGLLVVQLAFLDPDRSGPIWAVLQSLQLRLFFEGGRAYAQAEIMEMLEPCGFAGVRTQRTSLINPESLILATRPG